MATPNFSGMAALHGFTIYENNGMCTDELIKVPKSKSQALIDRVLRWNPCNIVRPDYRMVRVPSTEIFKEGNRLIMHPAVARQLREHLQVSEVGDVLKVRRGSRGEAGTYGAGWT